MSEWVEGKVVHKTQWTEQLFSLQFTAEIKPFKAGQFVRVGLDIGDERVGRPYSLVNAPHEPLHEIYFNIIPGGPLTPLLAALNPGDTLWVNDTANGFLTVDEIPQATHLWMLATGTALGPFLSIAKMPEVWQRFEKVILVHAVRMANELSYPDTITRVQQAHASQFMYIPFVSREVIANTLHGRIPARILDQQLEQRAGITLDPAQSHVMLCGNSAMIEDTSKVLAERGMKRHRRREPGHISTEKYH